MENNKLIEKLLSALLYFTIEDREQKIQNKQFASSAPKSEVLLNLMGFNSNEISKLTNKSQAAVIKSLQRSKGK